MDGGCGSVRVDDVSDARLVRIDTGSGSVVAAQIACVDLGIDTGSGSVEVEQAEVEELVIDTGSGGVDAYDISADDVTIDTGSGGVHLELLRMGDGRFKVDTGSGGIRMHVPRELSASFELDTGSGFRGIEDGDWAKIEQIIVDVHDLDGRLEEMTAILRGHGLVEIKVEQPPTLKGSDIYTVFSTRKRTSGAKPVGRVSERDLEVQECAVAAKAG